MKIKKMTVFISIGILVSPAFIELAFARQTVFPTGTTIYKPDEAHSTYILISDHNAVGNHPNAKVRESGESTSPDDIRLIDMNGNVVHTWKVAPNFNKRSRLLPNGNLVYVGPDKTIIEYDWNGNVVWKHEGIGSVNDMRILLNNNRLLIAHEPMPEEFQKRVKDVEIAPWWPPRKRGSEEKQLSADLYEINLAGEIVWEWHAYNHLDLNRFSPATPEGDWLHVNSVAPLPENKWYDAGDERFRPGNILLNARNIDTMYIIDKQTKKIVWEGTHNYKGGMAHCHEPEMIEKGLPGAGNIILFDNGLFTRHRTHTGQSFIIELNPVTQEIVWIYETKGYANIKFFSKTMGSQKRLPNGNTFIAEDNKGRLFQVKPDGEIVWEYVNRGGTTRPSPIPYDYTPQLRAMPKPEELAVTPPNNLGWHLKPDKFRKENPHVLMQTDLGAILIEVFEDDAPVTAANFLRYVDEGRYDSAAFYRVVRLDNQPNDSIKIEVIQGGLGFQESALRLPPITHETTQTTGIRHRNGVVSMARSAPGTASSEIFICIGDQPELDFGGRRNPDGQGFAAFGRVIEGMEVVKAIQQQPTEGQMLISPIKIAEIVRKK